MRKATPWLWLAAFIGILAWIAVPNLLTARNRSFQKRTLADMRTVAQALEARATDMNTYALVPADRQNPGGKVGDLTSLRRVSHRELAGALSPTYIKRLPQYDGWGREFDFYVADKTYTVRSAGSDRRTEGDTYEARTTSRFEEDVVYSEGAFIVYPEVS
jgi:type II secretory pathway pseudopilin PulG